MKTGKWIMTIIVLLNTFTDGRKELAQYNYQHLIKKKLELEFM